MVFAAGRGKAAVKKAPAAPKPVNLPSLKREHSGFDPNVALVPTGGTGGWGTKAGVTTEAASSGTPPSANGVESVSASPNGNTPISSSPGGEPVAAPSTPPQQSMPVRQSGAAPAWGGAGLKKGAPEGVPAPPPPPAPEPSQRPELGRRAYSRDTGIGGGGLGGGIGDRDMLGGRYGGDRYGGPSRYDRNRVPSRVQQKSDVVHWPGLADAVEEPKPEPAAANVPANGVRPQARLDESLTGAKIDMVQVRDDGTGWADDSSDSEMNYDDEAPLFDDMPIKNGSGPAAPADKAPVAPEVPASDAGSGSNASPAASPNLPAADPADVNKQNDVMKSTAQQARERREAEEREQERLRKERTDAKLKQLEDRRTVPPAPEPPKAAPPAPDTTVRPNGGPDLSKQNDVMKSTAQQARERREAEEREQERLRKERADAKLKELDAKRQQKAHEDDKRAKEQKRIRDQGSAVAQSSGAPVTIMERPSAQSRFTLWTDPDKQKKEAPKQSNSGHKGFDPANKYKTDDRNWRERDPAAKPAQNFTAIAKKPNDHSDSDKKSGGKNRDNGNQENSKQNRRDKEQKKREQAASLIDIPKPLPIGSAPPADAKQSGEKKEPASTADGRPTLEWNVKKMRKFCEEHLIPVTRSDTAETILQKIDASVKENGGVLKQKGQRKKGMTDTPKPRPSAGDGKDGKDDERRDRRREREGKGRDRRGKKDAEDKADKADKAEGDGKDKAGKDKEKDKEKGKEKDADKAKAGEEKGKQGVPTLESQGLQPVADGLMVGMGVAVAAGEVVQDHSGFTTVETHDKNQRKAAREKEIRDERRREKEEQRRRDKQAAKQPLPAPAPAVPKPAAPVALDMKSVPGEDFGSVLAEELDLGLHDAPRPHSIQDLNQQAVPKVAWSDAGAPPAKKPVSLLQVQVEEKFNKRLDPQFDQELEPQRQGSSSAIGPPSAADPWAAAPGSQEFSTAFQTAVGAQALPGDYNALAGLNMMQIRPSNGAPGAQPFSATPAASQPRFQALGLSVLGGADPFASAFGAPSSMDGGWGSTTPTSTPFAPIPGDPQPAPMSFVQDSAQASENAGRWGGQPRSAVGQQRAVGGKRGGGGQVAPGPASQSGAEGGHHGHVGKRHGRHGKGGGNSNGHGHGGSDNNNGGKGQKKNGGGKQGAGGRRGRGAPKDSGENGAAPAATPRPAGEVSNKANNRDRRQRRGGGGKQRGDKSDGGAAAAATPMPMAPPAPVVL